MKARTHEETGYWIAAGILGLLILLMLGAGSAGAYFFSEVGKTHYTCDDFTSYAQVKFIYDTQSATYLDGNNDGIPCNALYNKDHKPHHRKRK